VSDLITRRQPAWGWRSLALAIVLGPVAGAAWAADPAPAQAEAGTLAASSPAKPDPAKQFTEVLIPIRGSGMFGGDDDMPARVFKPDGAGPFPLVVFSHGRASDLASRRHVLQGVSSEQVRYWVGRGFAVVSPVRPGYGPKGGGDPESSGAHFSGTGVCDRQPDYRHALAPAVKSVEATLAWAKGQAWADTRRIVLVGQSMGGFTTVGSGAQHWPGVIGYVNFAGGAGGSPELSPGHSCDPRQLEQIFGELGKATQVPNLWVYAHNDQYFGPDEPPKWHAAFAKGGSPTRFVHHPDLDDGDGHGLSRHSRKIWGPYVDGFLAGLGFKLPAPRGEDTPAATAARGAASSAAAKAGDEE